MVVQRYTEGDKAEWDELVRRSRNGTFLHLRNYVGYLGSRVEDCSLCFRTKNGRGAPVCVLPASRDGSAVCSHSFLTYGGLVMHQQLHATQALAALRMATEYYRKTGFDEFVYKPVPHIYHTLPADDDLYALHSLGFCLTERKVSTALRLDALTQFNSLRRRELRADTGLETSEARGDEWAEFHRVLSEVLRERHRAKPVHSLEELQLLRQSFPENIKLFVARTTGHVIAGVVVYKTEQVVHLQYIAANGEGRQKGALTHVVAHVVQQFRGQATYLDFGTSMEPCDGSLNQGLARWKESFGARTVVYDTYCLRY